MEPCVNSCRGSLEALRSNLQKAKSRFIAAGAVKVEGTYGTVPTHAQYHRVHCLKGKKINVFWYDTGQSEVTSSATPQWQESRVTQPLKTFSPQIKVNAIASVLESGQNLVLFILLLKLGTVILQLMRALKTKNDNKRRSQCFFLPICHQKHLEVSEVPAPPLVFTNFRRSRRYVTPVSASRSEP